MTTMSRTPLATLDGPLPGSRIQLNLVQRTNGRVLIELREQHHADGIGWFDQRTLQLEPHQFQQIQAVLGLHSREITAALDVPPATIPFPGPAPESRPSRRASGDL